MKRWLVIFFCWCGAWSAGRAEEAAFSRAVRPADFAAAGLAKLSPAELTRLDALVRDYKGGVLTAAATPPAKPSESNEDLAAKLAAAKREAAVAEAARAVAETKAAKAEADATARVAQAEGAKDKKSEGSLLAKAKVLLTPGTEVEYATTESRIAGDFRGWEGKSIFTLENGQRWQVANPGIYVTPPLASPKVKIVPASMGGFWMTIEGVNQRVRVTPLGGGK